MSLSQDAADDVGSMEEEPTQDDLPMSSSLPNIIIYDHFEHEHDHDHDHIDHFDHSDHSDHFEHFEHF